MITLISTKNFPTISLNTKNNSCNSQIKANQNSFKLSGFNNPMRSYISFGICTTHYQAMYDINDNFTQAIHNKLKKLEQVQVRYELLDRASEQATILMEKYANQQFAIAEMIPSYAIMSGSRLREAMNSTETLKNPITSLIAINNIKRIQMANPELTSSELKKSRSVTQIYAAAIFLKQIEDNMYKPNVQENKKEIEELVSIVKKSIDSIYGPNTYERIKKMENMDSKLSDQQGREMLNSLIEVVSKAEELRLPDEFEEKLKLLLEKQNRIEGRTIDTPQTPEKQITIKISYFDPKHSHILASLHGHEHKHDHPHTHTHEPEYKSILLNKPKQAEQQTQVQLPTEKIKEKIQDKGENS